MNSRSTILNELKALNSQLPPDINTGVYVVPQGYFDGFADSVLARIKAENAISASDEISSLSPLLAGLSRKTPFTVPDNYFQENSENLSSVAAEEEESLVLSFVSKDTPYEVPFGYFASFPDKLIARLNAPQARVVPLFRRKWMKMAVAAMFAGVMAVSGFVYFNRESTVAPKDAVASGLKQASTEELNEFLKTTDVSTGRNVIVGKTTVSKPKESKTIFQDISDKELEAFLDEIPADELSFVDEETELLAN